MKIVIIIVIVVVVLLAAAAMVFGLVMKGPDLSGYEFLKNPRLINMADRKVLEITLRGQPDKVLPGAFKLLMQTYYKLKGVPKGPQAAAPCLRCARPEGGYAEDQDFGSQEDWRGTVAIAVPDTVNELPEVSNPQDLDIRLAAWEYGQVAEILHIGPYDKEVPAIRKLEEFIRTQGYTINGDHEEEYLRGPGMFFSKPEDYYTIIRYRVTNNREN